MKINHAETLATFALNELPEHVLSRSGAVLYSGASTLKKGDVYILGVNPGGDPARTTGTVSQSLVALPTNKTNAYFATDWGQGGSQAPLQRRLHLLSATIGQDLESICASNAVFMRSRAVTGINFWADAETCWPVQQMILDIVQPRLIIAFGNSRRSPYAFLRNKLAPDCVQEPVDAEHGNWKCWGFEARVGGRNVYVAGFPHLSRYSPASADGNIKEPIRQWLKRCF